MKRTLGILLSLAVAAAGCSGGGGGGEPGSSPNTTAPGVAATTTGPAVTATTAANDEPTTVGTGALGGTWTVLIYVMGDTDLEPFALEDILEMASVGSGDSLNIVALVDRHPEFSNDGVLNFDDWEETRLVLVERGELVQVGEGAELNLGDPNTLADFIETGIRSWPAEHYAVILWDHGAGWPGMGPDESDGLDVLDLADIQAGFAAGLERAGVSHVDLVGFDACLMATYEVASVMSPYARYMLASEELEPGHGWNYESLGALLEPGADAVDLGRAIIDGFAAQASVKGTDEDITLSLLDLSRISDLQTELAALVDSGRDPTADLAPSLGRVRARTLSFGRNPDPSLDSNMVDLGGLIDGLAESGVDGTEATRAALDDLVVASVNGRATSEASGLSVYFPAFSQTFRQGYLFLEGVPHWPDLLSDFYQAGAEIPAEERPEFVNEDGLAEYFFDGDGLNIFGTFDLVAQDNLTEAIIFYGILDESDDSIIFIGQEPADVTDDGSGLAGAIYDLTVLTISDGIDTAFAYLDLTFDPDTGLAFVDIPLAYFAPDSAEPQDVLLSLVFDPDSEEILDETYFVVDESGTFGEITTDPEGLIFPVVLNQYPDGSEEWIPTSDVGLFADLPSLQYEFVPLDAGTGLYAELVVFDYGGNAASVSMFDVIP